MKNIKYIALWTLGIVFSIALFNACEIDEPFIEPNASFDIWGVNPATNYYEKVEEPIVLIEDQTYDYIPVGEAQQFVFWYGIEGDTASSTPKGSNFEDRGLNHLSKGAVALNNRARYAYKDAGEYTLVFVASSYSYIDKDYGEMIIVKEIEVIPAPAK